MKRETYWSVTKNVPSTLSPHPLLPQLAASGASLLDVGCGEGRTLETMASQAGASGRFCGVDLNAGALAIAARRLPGMVFACAQAALLPFPDGAFDAASLHAVMTLIIGREARLAALGEIRRVIRARLFISDFLLTPEEPYYAARYAAGEEQTGEKGSFMVYENGAPIYTAHHYDLDELTGLLENAGYAVDDLETGKVRTRSGNIINGVRLAASPV